ncbi:MAG: S-layer homology domain-containing protein [Faecousia sp.]
MKKRILSLVLAAVMVLGLLPLPALAAERDEEKDQVRVIVENTTFTPDNAEELEATWEEGFWYGTLVDTWVELDESSTMMSCVSAALTEAGYSAEGVSSGYISSINGLGEFDGGFLSGWMGTLNDWFTNNGFNYYTVEDGTLEAGDEIRVMYTTNYGEDLGCSWSSNDTSLKALTFSRGMLTPSFDSATLNYTLSVPNGTRGLVITPTAANKNFQVHAKIGETEYKRSATVPVEDGTVITLEVGTGESMNSGATPTTYTVTIHEQGPVDATVSAQWPSFRGNERNNGITAAATPRTGEEAEIKWAVKHSTDWNDAPSPMILADDSLVVMYGSSLKKLSMTDGQVLATADMVAATSWGSVPPTYGDGIIFCPLGSGRVQAFNAKTLEAMWVYTDPLGGQAQSPITYSDGKVYVGFGYGREYAFVCLDATDGSLVWRVTDAKGYYWAGAVVVGDYVICGNDAGHLLSRNKETGELITDLDASAYGQIRSSVCYDNGTVYFTCNKSNLCWATLDGQTGELSNLTAVDCSAYGSASTCTPVVYEGLAYIGVGGWSGNKSVVCVDLETREIKWSIEEPAYPQCSLLLSTAYANTGYVYLYVTYNANPGGINVIKAKIDGSEAEQVTLFDAAGYEQFCICSVIAGEDGTLYYKNDSGNVFAISMTQAAKDALAAEKVSSLIDAIGTVTLESEDAISEARAAYDALTDAQKALVTNYERLTEAEETLHKLQTNKAAADAVMEKIDTIGTVTLDSEEAISEARAAYDALTEDQKALVSNYETLTEAEEMLKALQKAAADEQAAAQVSALIDAIGTVTLDSQEAIEKARVAYDALTEDQKALVTNYERLTEAEAILNKLKADKAAADAVMEKIDAIGTVTLDSQEAITEARTAYEALTKDQKALVSNYDVLVAAEETLSYLLLPHADVEKIYKTTGDYLENLAGKTAPVVGSIGGEWVVIGLARSGRTVPAAYYDNVLTYVRENINEKEQLHRAKSTENARVILALTALGKDVTDVAGHNLLTGLTDMTYLQKQGINGPIWALIAFDCGSYEIPAVPAGGDQVTREKLIDLILGKQLDDGGWALSGTAADPDMTAMSLQALAPYYKSSEEVKVAVDKALETLSLLQQPNGGFGSWGTTNSESSAQVIVALTALGIDPNTDPRFVKNGRSVVDALCGYYVEGGGFRHIAEGELDGMATEQGYYALTAYTRFLAGQTSLYDMSDVTREETPWVNPFVDVPENQWYYEYVKETARRGIFKGMDETHFAPDGKMTRAMLVTTLYRLAGEPAVTEKSGFADVADGAWYADAVAWARSVGIAKGVTDTTFCPNTDVTREQAAAFLYRYVTVYLKQEPVAGADLTTFKDWNLVSGYAKEEVAWAVAEGFFKGFGNGTLQPKGTLTRAQMAKLLTVMVQKHG